jgi:hypothetical protein
LKKRRLGKTKLRVSNAGFGGIPIIALSRNQAEKVVRYAYEKGINYFDTARAYGDSEEKKASTKKMESFKRRCWRHTHYSPL